MVLPGAAHAGRAAGFIVMGVGAGTGGIISLAAFSSEGNSEPAHFRRLIIGFTGVGVAVVSLIVGAVVVAVSKPGSSKEAEGRSRSGNTDRDDAVMRCEVVCESKCTPRCASGRCRKRCADGCARRCRGVRPRGSQALPRAQDPRLKVSGATLRRTVHLAPFVTSSRIGGPRYGLAIVGRF